MPWTCLIKALIRHVRRWGPISSWQLSFSPLCHDKQEAKWEVTTEHGQQTSITHRYELYQCTHKEIPVLHSCTVGGGWILALLQQGVETTGHQNDANHRRNLFIQDTDDISQSEKSKKVIGFSKSKIDNCPSPLTPTKAKNMDISWLRPSREVWLVESKVVDEVEDEKVGGSAAGSEAVVEELGSMHVPSSLAFQSWESDMLFESTRFSWKVIQQIEFGRITNLVTKLNFVWETKPAPKKTITFWVAQQQLTKAKAGPRSYQLTWQNWKTVN